VLKEAEAVNVLKEAMRRYSYNNLGGSELGVFKGVETDGVTLTLKLDGINLQFTPYEPLDVTGYEKKIANLQKTVEEQAAEIQSLKETEETPPQETTSLTTATKSASVRKRRKT
jgi:hypothetical protein